MLHKANPSIARRISLFTTSEIQDLFKKSRLVLRNEGFDARIAPAKFSYGRILVVTPKKIGNAPTRNKIRRQLKAIFYEEKLYLKLFDLVIFCKKEISKLNFNELKEILLRVINVK